MRRHNLSILALALLTGAPLLAADGILITQKTTVAGTARTTLVQIEKDRVRTDIEPANGDKQIMVFDGPKQTLTVIYPARKAYSEMTKADADRMGQAQVTMSPEMQAQIAKMPESQRRIMEQMMRGRGASVAVQPAKLEYGKTGTDKAGKWTCDKYDGFQDNVKKMEICTVPPATLGVAASDFDVMKQMASFFRGLSMQQSGGLEVGTAEMGFSGVPVRSVGFGAKGEVIYTSEIVDVKRQNFPASSYAVPAGFEKQTMLGGRGSAGRGPAPR